MKAAVLNIGNEILLGHTVNTDLSIIADTGGNFGIQIEEQRTVKDNKESIVESFLELLDKYNMVFLSGGLGPTNDDITTESVAYALNRELVFNKEIFERLQSYFKSKGRLMTDNNRKQAAFPRDCQVINNEIGTACGFFLRENKKWVIVLPGPPRELKTVLDNFFKFYNADEHFKIRTVNTYGIGESALEEKLRKIEIDGDYSVNTYVNKIGVDIKIVSSNNDENTMNKLVKTICESFEDYVYDTDSINISKSLLDKLLENNKKIVFGESCTGGHLSAQLTKNPGSSKSLLGSIVTYSDQAKMRELNVNKESLEKHTAVSEQVANEMLDGLIEKFDADFYAVSTGYASPTGDDKTNGLVFIGIYDKAKDERKIIRDIYYGSRLQIIDRVTSNVFFNILRQMR